MKIFTFLDHFEVSERVKTSAGNLFKFCCRASTEYQVAVSDKPLIITLSLSLLKNMKQIQGSI